ncbi:MAG: hypothetical protein ABI667_08085 [Sphingomicrobium sp.]
MGFEPPKPAADGSVDQEHDAFGAEITPHPIRNPLAGLTPVGSPVHDQQAELQGRLADCSDEGEEVDETAEIYEPQDGDDNPFAAVQDVEYEAEPVMMRTVDDFRPNVVVEEVTPASPVAEVVPMPVAAAPKSVVATSRPAPTPRVAAGTKSKAAFTLRLDRERHLKLRLACAVQGRSAQQLVTAALDALLADVPGLDDMAEQAPSGKRARN